MGGIYHTCTRILLVRGRGAVRADVAYSMYVVRMLLTGGALKSYSLSMFATVGASRVDGEVFTSFTTVHAGSSTQIDYHGNV